MTRKQESPYQISLDFQLTTEQPTPSLPSTPSISEGNSSESNSSEAAPIELEEGIPPTPYLLPVGSTVSSPGGHFTYRILGACCRLFDREELPWPCCRLQWRSKEPSWRRIGKRFVPDLATKRSPSYLVEILDHEYSREPFVLTLYWIQCPATIQNWWYTKYVPPTARSELPQNIRHQTAKD